MAPLAGRPPAILLPTAQSPSKLSPCSTFGLFRRFDQGNTTVPVDHEGYSLELGLHELMLQSPHRTLDPEVRWRCTPRLLARPCPALV